MQPEPRLDGRPDMGPSRRLGAVAVTGRDPVVTALRGKVVPVVTPGVRPEQVDRTIALADGRVLARRIEHAIGSVENPMSDADLERKFVDPAEASCRRRRSAG